MTRLDPIERYALRAVARGRRPETCAIVRLESRGLVWAVRGHTGGITRCGPTDKGLRVLADEAKG